MSTSGTEKHHFMVYAPDQTDPQALQRRLDSRPQHVERILSLVSNGVVSVRGPTLTPDSILPGAEQKMDGSMFIAKASSIKEVRDIVEGDIYYINNVWDKAKIIITPILLLV